jgi:hypothetical protein
MATVTPRNVASVLSACATYLLLCAACVLGEHATATHSRLGNVGWTASISTTDFLQVPGDRAVIAQDVSFFTLTSDTARTLHPPGKQDNLRECPCFPRTPVKNRAERVADPEGVLKLRGSYFDDKVRACFRTEHEFVSDKTCFCKWPDQRPDKRLAEVMSGESYATQNAGSALFRMHQFISRLIRRVPVFDCWILFWWRMYLTIPEF